VVKVEHYLLLPDSLRAPVELHEDETPYGAQALNSIVVCAAILQTDLPFGKKSSEFLIGHHVHPLWLRFPILASSSLGKSLRSLLIIKAIVAE